MVIILYCVLLSMITFLFSPFNTNDKHVLYFIRNSKLTFLLQNALGGNSKTALIVTLCPTDANAEESLFTLHFASRVRNINLGAAAKYSNSKNLEVAVKNLRIEVKELRRKKTLVEEALNEAKKDVKKASDKSTANQEVKLRALEENKRAAELLVQQLSKQLHDANNKFGDEHVRLEKLHSELDGTQKNMKKALEQLKELQHENDRIQQLLSSKERECESIQAALLRAVSSNNSHNHNNNNNNSGSDANAIAKSEVDTTPSKKHAASPGNNGKTAHANTTKAAVKTPPASPLRAEKVRVSFTFSEEGK